MKALRIAWRAPLALTLLLSGLLIVTLVFPRLSYHRRDRVIASWSALLLRTCGIRLREYPAAGATPLNQLQGGTLLLINHVSWLDIFLVLAIAPAHFVAKLEIAGWPLIGALVRGAGTLFIERGRRHAVHQLNERIQSMLNAGRRVAVFPEGTTSDGRRLLQFHGNLIEPALRAGVLVRPVALRYTDLSGQYSPAIDFTGDVTLVASLSRVLGAEGFIAEVHPLPPASGATRQQLAQHARVMMAERLALPLDDEVAQTLRRARGQA